MRFSIWLCCEYLQHMCCQTDEDAFLIWWCFFYLLVFSICFLGHRTAGLLIITLYRRGVDKNLVCLLRDWTEGNTMVKVWRQIQENHFEEYLHRKDLYNHTPHDYYEAWGDRVSLRTHVWGSTSSKRAALCSSSSSCLPAGGGQQRTGLQEPDSLHFWHSAKNGFH